MNRLPWFKCFPSKLLGALAGMQPDEGYLYVCILMRIYETGGPVADNYRILARRTGLTERRVSTALQSLVGMSKISVGPDGYIDSESTHENLAEQNELKNAARKAGKASADKRLNNVEQNQQVDPTIVEFSLDDRSTTKTKIETKIEKERIPEAPLELLPLPGPEAKKSKTGGQLAQDWLPSERSIEICIGMGYSRDYLLGEGLDGFRAYWCSLGGSRSRKIDWNLTYQNRMRERADRFRLTGKSPIHQSIPPQNNRNVYLGTDKQIQLLDDIYDRKELDHGLPELVDFTGR